MEFAAPASGRAGAHARTGVLALLAASAAWLVPVVVLGLIAWRRWEQLGPYVSGLDAGNWFALGRQVFGGVGKSTGGAYPPVIPAALHLGRQFADPLTVAKVVAVGSLALLMLSVFLVARQEMEWWFATSAAALVGLAGVTSETVMYGGYPQNTALAFGLVAAYAFARYLNEGTRPEFVVMVVALALTALTHHMYFAITNGVLAVIWLLWVATRPRPSIWLSRTLGLVAAEAIAILCFLPFFIALEQVGYRPPLNPSGLSTVEAFRYTILEAPWFWMGLFTAGITFSVLAALSARTPLWRVQVCLIASAILGFLYSKEPRLVPLLVIGSSLAVAAGLQALFAQLRGSLLAALPVAVVVALPLLLWQPADSRAAEFRRYYRVLSPSLVRTAVWLDANHNGSLVVVREDRNAWPIGWWFEGLTEARYAVGSSLKWLAIPKERSNARLAGQFFDERQSSAQAADLGRRTGVELLVFRKWDWIGWQAWLAEPAPSVEAVFDDGQFMILRFIDQAPP